ncbi:MAG: UDP-glucose 4-epimerase GalE [Synergistaceae bacterium]|jgi:UDP-glucose 4-epimerase|nr:UDP-glucose 4-epimerase GalE [Synergistaceae bacterium]
MTVLVTGGAGFIGSHTCVELIEAGYDVAAADSLINSSRESLRRVEHITGARVRFARLDVSDEKRLDALFGKYPDIDSVIHFAGLKAVGESVSKPIEYYSNNIESTLALLRVMRSRGVRNLVFSSSATVYGDPASVPVREDFPTCAVSPYGATKVFIERILSDVCAADPGFNAAVLRYFNPIGAHRSGLIGEDPSGIPNNLVPYVAQVAVGNLERVKVFGSDYPTPDGTGVRDYIHVSDLARGHVSALRKLSENCGEFVCNLGTGRGYSVLEVISAFERACGRHIDREFTPRRPGDAASVYADPSKAHRELGWRAEFDIDDMCRDAWRWQSANPNGYGR